MQKKVSKVQIMCKEGEDFQCQCGCGNTLYCCDHLVTFIKSDHSQIEERHGWFEGTNDNDKEFVKYHFSKGIKHEN